MSHCGKTQPCHQRSYIGGVEICACNCQDCHALLVQGVIASQLKPSHGPRAPAVTPDAPAAAPVDTSIGTSSKSSVGPLGAGTDKGSKGSP